MSAPLPFDPNRFRSAAAHYLAGRAPYPPGLIRRVAEAVRVHDGDRVLDLGCGPGQLAIGFAYFAGEVVGLDPEANMLIAAMEAARGLTPNVTFRQGSSYELGRELGNFRLVTMGRSFHWMDRAETLRRLDALIDADGAVALFDNAHLAVSENDWVKEWRSVIDRYAADDPQRERRRADTWLRHEAVLLNSRFSRLETVSVILRHATTAASLIDRALSMSSASRDRIGARADQMVRDLQDLLRRIAPLGTLTEVLECTALIARRPAA